MLNDFEHHASLGSYKLYEGNINLVIFHIYFQMLVEIIRNRYNLDSLVQKEEAIEGGKSFHTAKTLTLYYLHSAIFEACLYDRLDLIWT